MVKELESTETAIVSQSLTEEVKDLILTTRGMQVLLDSDVARLYGYETKRINETATRNVKRFPSNFRFQLSEEEADKILRFQLEVSSGGADLRSQFATSNHTESGANLQRGGRRYRPYAYTEQGIGMLSGLLKNDTAIEVSIGIMNAFVEMRKFINVNRDVFAKMVSIDSRLMEHDRKFDEVFDLLQQPEIAKQNIFFKGQFFDAFKLVIDIIQQAKSSITVIDSYANDSVLDMLAHKQSEVAVTIVTANPDKLTKQYLIKFIAQYGQVEVVFSRDFHDRFIILDDKEVYAFGASLKDLGKKCFEVSRNEDVEQFIAYVSKCII